MLHNIVLDFCYKNKVSVFQIWSRSDRSITLAPRAQTKPGNNHFIQPWHTYTLHIQSLATFLTFCSSCSCSDISTVKVDHGRFTDQRKERSESSKKWHKVYTTAVAIKTIQNFFANYVFNLVGIAVPIQSAKQIHFRALNSQKKTSQYFRKKSL